MAKQNKDENNSPEIVKQMKCFTTNPFVHWSSREQLIELIDQFWSDVEIPKNWPSLLYWLNMNKYSWEVYKKDVDYTAVLAREELRLEGSLIEVGMTIDRSFPKFLLETQFGYAKQVTESVDQPKLHIEVSIED